MSCSCLVVLLSFFLSVNGQLFTSREDFSGVSVLPDGTVYVSGESTLYRLGADLSERRPHLRLGSGARLIGYLPDPPRKRSILCWINSTNGACEVRSLHGDSVVHSTRNMRPNAAHGYGSTKFYMFRGGVTAEQLVGTRIAVSGDDFLVAQPVIRPDESTGSSGSSAMTMVRFNSSAQIEGFTGVVRYNPYFILSGQQQFISSFQAIFESESCFYFLYTIQHRPSTVYERAFTFVSRMLKSDNSTRKPFLNYSPGAYVSMKTVPMAERNAYSVHTIVSSAVFARPSAALQLGADSLLVMSFIPASAPFTEPSSIYALSQSSLDASLDMVYASCLDYPNATTRGSPFSVVLGQLCSDKRVQHTFWQKSPRDRLKYSQTKLSRDYHLPLEFLPNLHSSSFPSVGDRLYESRSLVFSSILMEVIEEVTLLLAGTQDGLLLKFKVTKSKSHKLKAHVFQQEKIDTTSRSLTGLTLSNNREYVYIVANRSDDSAIHRRPLTDCSVFTTCQSCLNTLADVDVQNPFCGWCTITNKCTRRAECTKKIRKKFFRKGFSSSRRQTSKGNVRYTSSSERDKFRKWKRLVSQCPVSHGQIRKLLRCSLAF